jgi:hypothetical protein
MRPVAAAEAACVNSPDGSCVASAVSIFLEHEVSIIIARQKKLNCFFIENILIKQ